MESFLFNDTDDIKIFCLGHAVINQRFGAQVV